MRPLCVHLGLPKTATTTLQRGLFAEHPEIEFLGKQPGRKVDPRLRRCASEVSFRLANHLFWEHARSIDVNEARRVWQSELRPAVRPGRLPVYSFEGLSVAELGTRGSIAENLRNVVTDCKVVIGIRRPLDLVEAVYFQRLKRRHLGLSRFAGAGALGVGEWLESILAEQELGPHLDYARTIRIFQEALGRSNVGVFAVEQLAQAPAQFAQDLCRFLEIDEVEGARLIGERRHNVRMSQSMADRMIRFEGGGLGSFAYALAGRSVRKRILSFAQPADPGPARLVIPTKIGQAIEDRTRDGNRWIEKELGLRLTDYGYPV